VDDLEPLTESIKKDKLILPVVNAFGFFVIGCGILTIISGVEIAFSFAIITTFAVLFNKLAPNVTMSITSSFTDWSLAVHIWIFVFMSLLILLFINKQKIEDYLS
jgi:hypothetical protein